LESNSPLSRRENASNSVNGSTNFRKLLFIRCCLGGRWTARRRRGIAYRCVGLGSHRRSSLVSRPRPVVMEADARRPSRRGHGTEQPPQHGNCGQRLRPAPRSWTRSSHEASPLHRSPSRRGTSRLPSSSSTFSHSTTITSVSPPTWAAQPRRANPAAFGGREPYGRQSPKLPKPAQKYG
jgi:hypothetical protein